MSPSTLIRNARRNEDFLAKKRSAASDKTEKEKAAVKDPTTDPVDKKMKINIEVQKDREVDKEVKINMDMQKDREGERDKEEEMDNDEIKAVDCNL